MKNSQQRITWLDTTRGLAFLVVIYVHIHCFMPTSVVSYLSPFFLCMFFFVSGYLSKSGRSFSYVFEQRTRTLFIPQLLFGLYIILLQQIHTTQSETMPIGEYFLQLFWHCTSKTGGHHGLWFVAALYSYSILFYWIQRWCVNKKKFFIVALLLFIANWWYKYILNGPQCPWYLHEVGFGVFYMSLGYLFRSGVEDSVDKWFDENKLICLMIIYAILITVLGSKISHLGSPFLADAIIISIMGIAICIYLCKYYLYKIKLLNYIGSNSLLYFGFHHKILVIISLFFAKLYTTGLVCHNLFIDELLRWAAILIIALVTIIPTYIVNRWLPWVTGKGYKLWNIK